MIYPPFLDGWTTDDLQYLWKPKDPVQIVPDLHLPRFTLEKYISDYCNIKTNTGKYPYRLVQHKTKPPLLLIYSHLGPFHMIFLKSLTE